MTDTARRQEPTDADGPALGRPPDRREDGAAWLPAGPASGGEAPARRAMPGEAPTVLLLVDDHPLRRASLARFLENLPQGDGPGFRILDAPAGATPDMAAAGVRLVLLNIGGAPASAPAVADRLRGLVQRAGRVPVVVLSDNDAAEEVVSAVAAGALGFLTTMHEPQLMFGALRFIAAGGSVFPPQALLAARGAEEAGENGSGASSRGGLHALTQRQRDVLRLLGQGHANKRIAIELRMCESTVKVHVRQIMRKLKAANRTQAALLAQEMLRDRAPETVLDTTAMPPPACRETGLRGLGT